MPDQTIPKPNFIIIGSAKCGTTTLAKVLADHPECCFSRPKEVCFFCSDEITARGWSWYREHFNHYTGEPAVGEATPAYTDALLHPNTAKRMFEFNPAVKLIYIVRNPYERFVSGWRMHCSMYYKAHQSRDEAGIDAYFHNSPRREADIKACCYSFQLSEYLKYFPSQNIHIMFLEDLSQDFHREMAGLCNFIGIDPQKLIINNTSGENKGDSYQYTVPAWEKMRKSSLTRMAKLVIPISIRNRLFNRLLVKKVSTPRQDLSAENRQIFWDIVSDDARNFLKAYGKPADFWALGFDDKTQLSAKQLSAK